MQNSLANLQNALNQGETTAIALADEALRRIEAADGQGAKAFTQVYAESARAAARASDTVRQAGTCRSPIEGLTVSVKDLFDVAGQVTTAGSTVLRDSAPARSDAGVVQRLRQAGAVLTGKTNMTEFAYSGLGINPHYGTPLNPWQRQQARIPGGSSSGAAVAVCDGMCVAAIGSDTGGSARIPAAFCGITGFKPTARRMPADGMIPLSTSLDAVGVLAADVSSISAVDQVLAGQRRVPRQRKLRQGRFAVPTTIVLDGLDGPVAAAWSRALGCLSAAGAELVELPVPEFSELADINAEGGFSAAESWAWHADLLGQRGAEYDPLVLSRIRRGEAFSARAYLKLQAQRRVWQDRVLSRLQGFDAWLMPTVPMVAPRLADLQADEALYFSTNAQVLRNPSIVNFMDGCAISLPCHAPGEAPVGLSLAAPAMADDALLDWAKAMEPLFQVLP